MDNNFNLELTIPNEVSPGGMTVRMAGTPEEPLFCLADVCLVLGNANPSQVAARLDAEDKTLHIVEVNGQASSQMQFVTEPALYDVVLTSLEGRFFSTESPRHHLKLKNFYETSTGRAVRFGIASLRRHLRVRVVPA